MHTRVRKQFPLPVNFIPLGSKEWVPPASHDETEAERRRQGVPGQLVLEQQHDGARISARFLRRVMRHGTPGDISFGTQIISSALFGSARLSLQTGNLAANRKLDLPIVADPENDKWLTKHGILLSTLGSVATTVDQTKVVLQELQETEHISARSERNVGLAAGAAALWVALLPQDGVTKHPSAKLVQDHVFEIGLNALDASRELGEQIGVQPTLAVLAGPEANEINVYLEKTLSHGAVNAMREARHAVLRETTTRPR